MANYIEKLQIVDATRWWKAGDHPDVKLSVFSDGSGQLVVNVDTNEFQESTVQPGEWIVDIPTGAPYRRCVVMTDEKFKLFYEPEA